MEFANGKHLVNYLLKIFKNNSVDIPNEHIENIRDLEHVFNFMTNLPTSIRKNIDFSDGYYPLLLHKVVDIRNYQIFQNCQMSI